MTSEKEYSQNYHEEIVLRQLDRGIDDIEAGRVLPLDEAFQEINEIRENRSNSRQKQKNH